MSHVYVDVELSWKKRLKVRMLVDTGATHTVLPIDLARRLGMPKSPQKIRVELADGTRKRMEVRAVVVRLLGREAGDTVLIGPRGAEPLLGIEALEALGLAVDPRRGRLVPTRGKAVMLVGVRTLGV